MNKTDHIRSLLKEGWLPMAIARYLECSVDYVRNISWRMRQPEDEVRSYHAQWMRDKRKLDRAYYQREVDMQNMRNRKKRKTGANKERERDLQGRFRADGDAARERSLAPETLRPDGHETITVD